MEATEVTVRILESIRDEVMKTNERLDQTNGRLDQTNGRLDAMSEGLNGRIDAMREELSRRIVESEVRTATAITQLAGTVQEMTDFLRAQNDLRPRVERCEQEIDALKRQIGPKRNGRK